ncbi:DUF983 domain-containing protein [Sphingomonas sp. MMS24-JH45]
MSACPRCGARTLFRSWIGFAETCCACGLRFSDFNVGDGPAAFLTLGIGTIVTVLAIWLELAAMPPWWVHVLIWLPITLAGVMATLRIAKGWLLALEYRNAAREEGREMRRVPVVATLVEGWRSPG